MEAANATPLPRGTYIESKSCLNEEKENTRIDAMNHSNKFCHPAHHGEQQQHAAAACSNSSVATQSSSRNTWSVYTNTYYSYVVQQRATQWYSYNISGPGTLL